MVKMATSEMSEKASYHNRIFSAPLRYAFICNKTEYSCKSDVLTSAIGLATTIYFVCFLWILLFHISSCIGFKIMFTELQLR